MNKLVRENDFLTRVRENEFCRVIGTMLTGNAHNNGTESLTFTEKT